MRTGIVLAALLIFPAFVSIAAFSATIVVPDDYATIQDAINASVNGDTVLVKPGTYVENINFFGKAITVKSSGSDPAMTVIDGQSYLRSVVKFVTDEGPDSVLEGFTLTNGSGTSVKYYGKCGGGIFCEDASPTLVNNIITGNSAVCGGGIACRYFASPKIMKCIITGNHATEDGGGIYCSSCEPVISSCLITYNTANEGSGIYCVGSNTPDVLHCTLSANSNDGFYCASSSETKIKNSIIWNNGNHEIYYTHLDPTVTYCDVKGGWPGTGNINADPLFVDAIGGDFHLQQDPCQPGVVNPCVDAGDPASALPGGSTRSDLVPDGYIPDMGYHDTNTVFVPDDFPTIQGAVDSLPGGGIVMVRPGTYVENLSIIGKAVSIISFEGPQVTVLDGNQAGTVVTFQNDPAPGYSLEGFTIRNGLSPLHGGGVFCSNAAPTLSNNIITDNSAPYGHGGGMYLSSALPSLVVNNVLHNNSAGGDGGGLACFQASPLLESNLIFNNEADSGGGVSLQQADPTLVNGMIYGNHAVYGGGVHSDDLSSPIFTNTTLCGNSASASGGGIECGTGYPIIVNGILWYNTAPAGSQVQGSNPMITYSNVEGGWSGAGNLDLDPLFKDPGLGDYHLTLGSPCIDKGDVFAPSLPDLDYEGDPRIVYGLVDMGADEYTGGGTVLHVPAHYPTIMDAIDAAYDGDIVLVAPGTYEEIIDYKKKALHLRSELGPESTILEGKQHGILVTISGISPQQGQASLEGFTVRNASWYGIYCENVTVTITNNIIRENSAYGMGDGEAGTGIFCDQSTPTITGNSISGSHEGGVLCWSSTPVISNNRIYYNGASGIECSGCPSALITDNTIFENCCAHSHWGNSYGYGGGIAIFGSTSTIINNIICNNSTFSYYGGGGDGGGDDGGLSRFGGSPGGGIYCSDSNATLINNIIADNASVDANQNASGTGGGVFCEDSSLIFAGNTVCNNAVYGPGSVVNGYGGGICSQYNSSVAIANSIFWNNQATAGSELCLYGSSHIQIRHSDLMGGQANVYIDPGCTLDWSAGMIDSDPLFVDAAGGDYHLTFTSPCRGSGDNAAVTEITDFEGDPRIAQGTVDMGADEFYRHLYFTGDATPGSPVSLKLVDLPGASPVGFWIALDALENPMPGAYGDWHLLPPMVGLFTLPPIPSSGVYVLPGNIPASPPGPYTLYLQAIMGTPAQLTNLCTIQVSE